MTTFECTFDHNGVFKGVEVTGRPHQGGNSGSKNDIPYAAQKKCTDTFALPAEITSVTALRPGYWEVIMQSKANSRMVACTVSSSGDIEDWVEMN